MPDLLGNPTLAELDDLIAAKDATIVATTQTSKPTLATWHEKDPAASDSWATEWDALRARYNAARALRVHAAGSLAMPPEVIWGRVMQSIRQAWDPAGSLTQAVSESAGDLQDLVRRLSAQGAAPDFSNVPQPVASDPALKLFQAADVVVRSLPSFGAGVALLALLFVAARKW